MPIKPEDILTALDIDPEQFDDVKTFTETFGKEWTRVSEAAQNPEVSKAVFGKVNATLRQRAKKALAAFGIEGVKVDDHDPTELIDMLATKGTERFTGRIAELEAAVKEGGSGKAVKELEAKLAEAMKKATDMEALSAQQAKKYEELEGSVRQREAEAKINAEWERALGGIKWKQGIDDLTRDGFVARVKKEYRVQFDESGNPYATDANGQRVADPVKAQKYLDLGALVGSKAKEYKLDEAAGNPQGGKPVGQNKIIIQPPPGGGGEGDKPLRPVHVGLRG